MRLTVLGNSSRYLAPLGAGTSYLLESSDARIVLDCGNGTHLRLAERLEASSIDAVVVSHFHIDSAADLLPVLKALPPGARVHLPKGSEASYERLLHAFHVDEHEVAHVHVEAVAAGDVRRIRGTHLTFGEARHGCPAVAARIDGDGRSLAYFPDTGPHSGLVELAKRADLVVAHTLLLDEEAEGSLGRTNLSAGAAGRIAREAGAGRLALSHIPFYRDVAASLLEAREAFGGDVLLLREGETLEV